MAYFSTAKNSAWSTQVDQAGIFNIKIPTGKTCLVLDRDISITVPSTSVSVAGGAPSIEGGASSATPTNIELADSEGTTPSGIKIKAQGTATPKTAAITYTNTKGWIGDHTGVQGQAAQTGTSTAIASRDYYVKGVTLNAPTSGTNQFKITVPNGSTGTITFTFKVDSNKNVWVE